MSKKEISGGVVHRLPTDLKKIFLSTPKTQAIWKSITPLARNEWICWIESAKKDETRKRRILVGLDKMSKGMRRPCCWAGCPHR